MSFKYDTDATIIADSISPEGVRLTTIEVTFHRFILAEVNTHRAFSRNSASSRAIPLETMLERATMHPAIPLKWASEQKGMSGGDELTGDDLADAVSTLEMIRGFTTRALSAYVERHPDKSTRLHKSLLNRPLEWFMWHTAIITSTDWDNMFAQRISPSAQPEFDVLARLMKVAMDDSTPQPLLPGDYHLPYTSLEERNTLDSAELLKISTARCARVSYLTHDGVRDTSEDVRMYDETLWSHGHWSPMEHPAMCVLPDFPSHGSNFAQGWEQLRGFVENDVTVEQLQAIATAVRVHSGQEVSEEDMRASAEQFKSSMTAEEIAAIEETVGS
jgi:hypothetical protein